MPTSEILANPLVAAVIGGSVVAFVTALLARRRMQSEIEVQQLLRAYDLLQSAVAFVGDDEDLDDRMAKLTEEERLALIDSCGQAVLVLDLLGSRAVLKVIRQDSQGDTVSPLDITRIQTVLRRHIRKRLGLPVFGIPRQLTIVPAHSIAKEGEPAHRELP